LDNSVPVATKEDTETANNGLEILGGRMIEKSRFILGNILEVIDRRVEGHKKCFNRIKATSDVFSSLHHETKKFEKAELAVPDV
jgi:hypothetical protein